MQVHYHVLVHSPASGYLFPQYCAINNEVGNIFVLVAQGTHMQESQMSLPLLKSFDHHCYERLFTLEPSTNIYIFRYTRNIKYLTLK